MQLHTCLTSSIKAFHFEPHDFNALAREFPHIAFHHHSGESDLLGAIASADYLLTWNFADDWYAECPRLKAVLTPAAGNDWVKEDPTGRVRVFYGTFHGSLMAESVLGAILFMNRRMPDMIRNFQRREWNRNLQAHCQQLRNQMVLIVGFGHIGTECASVLRPLAARVVGVKRNPAKLVPDAPPVEVRSAAELDDLLSEADHVVLLLPGDASADQFFDRQRLLRCKAGACVYNFGRGNALHAADVVAVKDHIGGAFLDVIDQEPLDPSSPLWDLPNVFITPHSSCVYEEYKQAFIKEAAGHLSRLVST